jgi:hypothetical protein
MSWISKIKDDFIIKTGDGIEYKFLLWKNASRSQEYNLAEFEFPEIDGTLGKRSRPKGMRYPIELYFQGEDNLDQAEAFRISADDQRAWTITHPFYGSLTVHPVSLNYDNNALNVTKVTGMLMATITDDRPKTSIDPKDKISVDKENVDQILATSFVNNVQPNTTDINSMAANNEKVYNIGKKKVKLTVDAEKYFNSFNTANAAIIEATSAPLDAIGSMQTVINAPALFADKAQNRINTLVDQFDSLRISLENITEASKKRIFENNVATLIGAMLLASSTPLDDDYTNRNDVLLVIETLVEVYETYLEDLDGLQTETGGDPESFIPDADSMIALNALFNYTLSNLSNIALDSKQERTVILEDDSNPISLAHRFYGLTADDSTIIKFIDQNEMGLNEMLTVRKNRTIKYYV